jgi:cobalt/nickel transport system permease protein
MGSIESSFFDIGRLDALSSEQTVIHRIDARVKVLTTIYFIVVVISFGKYDPAGLVPLIVYPMAVMTIGNIPFPYIAKKLLIASPFVLSVALFNPLMDRSPAIDTGIFVVSGGLLSFTSIMAKYVLTVSAALALIACTGVDAICSALARMGVPRAFTVQLLFLYRYIFVLGQEAVRISRARALRSFGSKGLGMNTYASMIGHLLLRTMDRAQRIHLAMLCRGFGGEIHYAPPSRIRLCDLLYLAGWSALFTLLRLYSLPAWLGRELAKVI